MPQFLFYKNSGNNTTPLPYKKIGTFEGKKKSKENCVKKKLTGKIRANETFVGVRRFLY